MVARLAARDWCGDGAGDDVSGGFEDAADVHTLRRRKARKAHQCCACAATIPAGSHYTLTTIICDGIVDKYKRCPRCEHIHARLVAHNSRGGCCDPEDWPREDLNCGHVWDSDLPDDLAALAFATDAEIQERSTELLKEVTGRDR